MVFLVNGHHSSHGNHAHNTISMITEVCMRKADGLIWVDIFGVFVYTLILIFPT